MPPILTRDTDTIILYIYNKVGVIVARGERDDRWHIHLAILQTIVYHIRYNVLKGDFITKDSMTLSL